MAFNTIDGLINEIVSWSNNAVTTLQATGMVTLAEDRIFREVKTRQMEASTTIALTGGVATVPGSLTELRNAYISSTPYQNLQRKTPDWIRTKYPLGAGSGLPKYIARDNSNYIFGPTPTSGHSVVLNFYERPATAVGSTLTGLLSSSPGLLLYAALSESEPFLGRDERVQVWEGKYQNLRDEILLEDKKEKTSGPALAVTTA